ncbi:hypothetical protein AD945_00885 [Gluconobacter albidus]|uniref:Uncharacterized protein n=1 Tax=Gluconobacter albidus TaxID=318683 RepID=A0A149TNC8_9PROT|nr:hypothetical protein [Gluconobacter albidus]KXV51010.1 hypothetical protein AD945_00885 [Gluconobacter albidus]
MADAPGRRIAEVQTRFDGSLNALRDYAQRWMLQPRSPEAKIVEGMLHLMEMNSLHQTLLVTERLECEARMQTLLEASDKRMEEAVSRSEILLEQCRRTATEEILEVRRALHEGVAASRNLQKIDDKTVKAKVAEILGTVKKEVALSMNLQIKQAGVYVRRDRIMQQAAWFATMIVGGTVFGIIIDHLI